MNRIITLDYLRGLCAISIMIYHYLTFSGLVKFDSSDFLGRMGVYGVSIFYILSGLTLFLVYRRKFKFADFYINRVFRIFPLLWVTITLSLIVHNIHLTDDILLWNYTGLFGIFRWWQYIGTGVWSIGNELVFYLMFPVILFAIVRSKYWILVLGLILLTYYSWFAFYELNPAVNLSNQWRDYVNPLNQAFLFFIGVAIGCLFNEVKVHRLLTWGLLIISVAAFVLYPTEGNTITLVTGLNRIIFTVICAIIAFSFFKINYKIPIVDPALKLLGEASYSIYLLHPLVWVSLSSIDMSPIVKIVMCAVLSIGISIMVYKTFELPFMKLGKRLIKRISQTRTEYLNKKHG
jgi:exopolysaccharide production protein ExoZ